MVPATARLEPTSPRRLAMTRPPRVWTELTLEQQQHVAHIVAVLVRRIHQRPQPDSLGEPPETLT
jgi:hypothetical protein